MSYILQALKKAEAERGLGQVPGLAELSSAVRDEPSGAARRVWLGGAVVVTFVVLAVLMWWWLGRTVPLPAVAQASVPASTVATAAPPGAVAAPPTASAAAPPAVALAAAVPAAVSAPLAIALQPAPAVASARSTPPPTPQPTQPPAPPNPAVPVDPPPWPSGPGWPTLTLSGSVYSELPRERMLVINGQVLREGDAADGDLTLLRIGAKSAVLRYKGTAYLWRY